MSETAPAAPADAFWRCPGCGTPNPGQAYVRHCLGCGRVRPVNAPAASAPRRSWSARVRPWVVAATYGYALAVLACLALIRWVGDVWWGVVALLFVPRWLFLAPGVPLALLAAWARKPSLWLVQGATVLVVAGPLMLCTVPLVALRAPRVEGEHVRVLTYNLGDHPFDARGLTALLERERIDVVCFQEEPRHDPALDAYFARGWHEDRGRFVVSRFPVVRELEPLSERFESEERYAAKLHGALLRARSGREFVVASLHMPTLRPGLNRLLDGNPRGLQLHVDWWKAEIDRVVGWLNAAPEAPLVVAGDFNMPSDDSTMASLRTVFRFAFEDAGWGYGYTRPADVPWFRIDHIMASPEWRVTRCRVAPDFGSDHLPLIAELVLPAAPAGAAGSP